MPQIFIACQIYLCKLSDLVLGIPTPMRQFLKSGTKTVTDLSSNSTRTSKLNWQVLTLSGSSVCRRRTLKEVKDIKNKNKEKWRALPDIIKVNYNEKKRKNGGRRWIFDRLNGKKMRKRKKENCVKLLTKRKRRKLQIKKVNISLSD